MPSIANVMVPRAIADVRKALPNLLIEVDILKIEDAVDYLLLGKGELVALSYKLDHPMLAIEPLARGRLKCIVPEGHPLARRTRVTADEIVKYPLIGVDPNDPYGRIMAGLFASHALHYEVTIRARFGSTVCALVSHRTRHCHRRRVHLGRRPVAAPADPRYRRADRVSDLYRAPQGCAAIEPRGPICRGFARPNGVARARARRPREKNNIMLSFPHVLVIDLCERISKVTFGSAGPDMGAPRCQKPDATGRHLPAGGSFPCFVQDFLRR